MTPQDPQPTPDQQPDPQPQPPEPPGPPPGAGFPPPSGPPQEPPAGFAPPPGPPPQDAPGRRLRRSSSDKLLGGVAGGLGRHLDLDPALVRIAFVVLALFGGSGVAIYLVLWLLLPPEHGPARVGGDSPRSHKVALAVLIAIVVVSLPFTGPGFLFAGPALVVVAVIGAFGVLLWRAVGGEGSPTLTRLALVILAIAGATALGLGAGVAAAFGATTAMAIVVGVTGLALIVGGVLGGARWLVIPAIAMAIPVAFVAAADVDLTGGVGERNYRPSSMADIANGYRLGAGEMRIDLRGLDLPAGRTELDASVGIGRVEITVPAGVCVQTRAEVGVGEVARFGRVDDGVDVRVEDQPSPRGDAPVLAIDADAGMGQVQVDTTPDDDWDDGFGRRVAAAAAEQPACAG